MRLLRCAAPALLFPLLLATIGCGPAAHRETLPRYPNESSLRLAGERCRGAFCACRPLIGADQEEASPPAPGTKRFEIRIPVTVHPVWVHIPGVGTLHKGTDRGDETCAYVDLPPGEHEVTYVIRERNRYEGFAALFRISEYGSQTRGWYETFSVDCGVADGACTKAGLKDWAAAVAEKKGIFDHCSSTRFKNVRHVSNEWEGGKLQELAVTVTLKVYKFEPKRPPKSFCEGRAARGEDPADAPPGPDDRKPADTAP